MSQGTHDRILAFARSLQEALGHVASCTGEGFPFVLAPSPRGGALIP